MSSRATASAGPVEGRGRVGERRWSTDDRVGDRDAATRDGDPGLVGRPGRAWRRSRAGSRAARRTARAAASADSGSTPAVGSTPTRTSQAWAATSLSRMPSATASGTGSGRKPRSIVRLSRCSALSPSTTSRYAASCSTKPAACSAGSSASQRAQTAWLSSASTGRPAAVGDRLDGDLGAAAEVRQRLGDGPLRRAARARSAGRRTGSAPGRRACRGWCAGPRSCGRRERSCPAQPGPRSASSVSRLPAVEHAVGHAVGHRLGRGQHQVALGVLAHPARPTGPCARARISSISARSPGDLLGGDGQVGQRPLPAARRLVEHDPGARAAPSAARRARRRAARRPSTRPGRRTWCPPAGRMNCMAS